jgi:DUF971 family protein
MTTVDERPWPSELRLREEGAVLKVSFENGESYELAAEYLRVESPSAEVKGHGPGQEVTVAGKRAVRILSLDLVGNYAVKVNFSDGHATGLYAWDYLRKLGTEHDEIWPAYLAKLEAQGLGRD